MRKSRRKARKQFGANKVGACCRKPKKKQQQMGQLKTKHNHEEHSPGVLRQMGSFIK